MTPAAPGPDAGGGRPQTPEAEPPTDDGARRQRRDFLLRLLAVVVLGVAVWILTDMFGEHHRLFDFRIYRKAVIFWLDGNNNIYDYSQPDRINNNLGFTYPPFAALIMVPLAVLPYGLAKWIHLVVISASLGVMCYWLGTPLARRYGQPAWFVLGLTVPLAFALEPVRESLSFGQVNHELAVLIIGDLLFLVHRKSRWAGIGIGVATAIKLTPGIFIVYLLVTRRWKAAVMAMASATAATLLAAAFDLRSSLRFWLVTFWDSSRVGILDQTPNQSINGMILRWFDDIDPAYPRWIWLLAVGIVVVFGLWRAARAAKAGDTVAALTFTGLVGVMVSPVSWIHHNFWIVPALIVVADVVLRARGWRRWAWGGLFMLVYWPFALTFSLRFAEGATYHWKDGTLHWIGENGYVFLSLLLIAAMPVRRGTDAEDLAAGTFWPRWPSWVAGLPGRLPGRAQSRPNPA